MSTSASARPPGAGATGARSAGVLRRVALVAAVVSVLAAVAFPFASVTRPEVTYSWPSSETPVGAAGTAGAAIPMLPYQPVTTTASVTCDAVRAAGPGTTLLSTVPLTPDPLAEPLQGLRVVAGADAVAATVGGRDLTPVALPPGGCTVTLVAEVTATSVTLTAPGVAPQPVERVAGDVRPAVAGAFTGAASTVGLSFSAVGDTRFQTSAGPLKIALGVVAVLAFAVALGALVVAGRRARSARDVSNESLLPSGTEDAALLAPSESGAASLSPAAGSSAAGSSAAGSPAAGSSAAGSPAAVSPAAGSPNRVVDLAVVGTLLLWQVIGPLTVDDGYIAGIVRSRGENGQVGTVFRWLNSPEAPFGWFYDVLALIAALDPAPFWLRLPATALGVVGWFLLTRAVLPRLRLTVWPPLLGWVTAVVYLAWWLPYDLGVRPEPWVLVGATTVLVLVERALERRSVTALVVAFAVAGVTLAVTPTGLMAVAPLLAAVTPLVRLVRDVEVGRVTTAAVGAAALGLTLVLVYADQTWASVLDSVGIRTLVGGDRPWTDEYVRYATLLEVGDAEGSLGRRAPVLLLALAVVALLVSRRDRTGLAHRLLVVTGLSLVALAFTPTKWTHHLGAFAVLGTAVTLLALQAWLRHPTDAGRAPRRAAVGVAVAAGASGVTLAGYNQWHWISSYAVTWSTVSPELGGVRLADAVLVLGVVLAVGLAATAVRISVRRAGEPDTVRQESRSAGVPAGRLLAVAPALALGVVALVVAIEVLSFAHTAVQRRDSYTLASDSIASLTGRSCGIADQLRVEPDPAAGLLPADPGPGGVPAPLPGGAGGSVAGPAPVLDRTDPATPVMSGVPLPGWRGPGVTTGWFALPGAGAPAAAPGPTTGGPGVVVTLTGTVASGEIVAEFGDRAPDGTVVVDARVPLDEQATQYSASASAEAPRSRDLRLDPALAAGHAAVRLVSGPDTPAAQRFSAPRLPVTVPWSDVLTPGAPAALDWPGAFLFPCTPFAPLRDGIAELPGWRVSTDIRSQAESGYISYTATQGGPWTTARALVRPVRYAVYLPGLPLTDVASLERWDPTTPLVAPQVSRTEITEPGWSTSGPLSIGES